ncbi:LLM class F420-dependent oxidoreductase [Mycobacterium heidelbergense]|uniref:LLM class F420-dependent oxidoreductase n=2 Tax=Mycobacterium heidelbergense TaxID=53376 RepID=A0A1X0DR69_MYCHE|nr:LLM class F420-dependent oxidoreductase [Mycobacterium heidelbergense]MCV7051983.1 LLM class F420-dependent oxidoreductase [Mycobacterium heidelbergense]ORA74712.1 LLM class F420-dependent oxidoreductase [Mycobacterium heidelbergense]
MTAMSTAAIKIDGGIPMDLARVPGAAAALERRRYDGCWCGEISHDPFLPMLLAAEHTSTIELGTGVAVAFARNPMTVATVAWDLQSYSDGRFILGLGTQVQAHIEKRFSMPWSQPVRRMREFVLALRAIWDCWQAGSRLSFEGDFYTHKLMTPMFTPEPLSCALPKVFVAAVGEAMTRMCGEVADGLIAHAFTTRRYMDEVTLPALLAGMRRSGRGRGDVAVSCPVFVVTGRTESEMAAAAAATRKQIAFYGSTPAYRRVLDLHGWGELHTELHRLSLRGEWDAMGALIDDEVLGAFAVVAPVDEVAAALRARCHGLVDRVMPAFPAALPSDVVAGVVAKLRQDDSSGARR